MKRLTLWPRGLFGRVGLVLFVAVLLEIIGSAAVFEHAEFVSGEEHQAWRVADRVEAASRVLSISEPARRKAVARTLSVPGVTMMWREAAGPARIRPGDDLASKTLRDDMIKSEPALAGRDLNLRADPMPDRRAFDVDLRLDDGSLLVVRVSDLPSGIPNLYAQLVSVLVLSACVLLAALIVVRTLAAPLAMMVRATDAIGHGPPVRLAVQGPDEVKRVARAFNAMHDRIARLIRDRTQALAAVSHDLRTPISRMRLRAGFLASAEDEAAFENDLDEMEAMIDDLLAYLGGDSDPEKPRRTDLVAMLTTIIDAATDAGHAASYDGPAGLTLAVRAGGLKRALSNLVNNALAYGKSAHVVLHEDRDAVRIAISDAGPGIPEADFDAVFEPFHRLEESRNRGTGGSGLGLTIARQAVMREGGRIQLANRSEGGLRVTVVLPKA